MFGIFGGQVNFFGKSAGPVSGFLFLCIDGAFIVACGQQMCGL